MNIIVENLIKYVKSKPSDAYSAYQLEELYHDICAIYFYTTDKADREALKKIFNRIMEKYTEKTRFGHLNPGALEHIDKVNIKF